MSWSCNWDYSETGTSDPTPRPSLATMVIDGLHESASAAADVSSEMSDRACEEHVKVVKMLWMDRPFCQPLWRVSKVEFRTGGRLSPDRFEIHSKDGGGHLISGNVVKFQDSHLGVYAVLQAKCEDGACLMEMFQKATDFQGFGTMVLRHEEVRKDVGGEPGLVLVRRTGRGPDGGEGSEEGGTYEDDGEFGAISTRFALVRDGEEVARCLLSYRDGSIDPNFGPTFEAIEARSDFRGLGYCKFLFDHAVEFIQEFAKLVCYNTESPETHLTTHVKCTELVGGGAIEEVVSKGGERKPLTDKDFFYSYAGFSPRELKGVMAMFSRGRPADEEAIKFVPKLNIDQRESSERKRPELKPMRAKERGESKVCEVCRKVSATVKKCGGCKKLAYCSQVCQKADWKKHRMRCGKTPEKMHDCLVKNGVRVYCVSPHDPDRPAGGEGEEAKWWEKIENGLGPSYSPAYTSVEVPESRRTPPVGKEVKKKEGK